FFHRTVGESRESGVSFPDYVKVAQAYGLAAQRITGADFRETLRAFLDAPGPALADVEIDGTQQFEPRMSSRQHGDGRILTPPLEDMYPFLPREELAENMINEEEPVQSDPEGELQ